MNKPEKSFAVLLLDSKYRYVDCALTAKGKTCRPEDHLSEILLLCKDSPAKYAVICHNHRDNSKAPSVEDIYLTRYLEKNLLGEGVKLLSHYIVTSADCIDCMEDM